MVVEFPTPIPRSPYPRSISAVIRTDSRHVAPQSSSSLRKPVQVPRNQPKRQMSGRGRDIACTGTPIYAPRKAGGPPMTNIHRLQIHSLFEYSITA